MLVALVVGSGYQQSADDEVGKRIRGSGAGRRHVAEDRRPCRLHRPEPEFDEPTPAPAALAERIRQLLDGGDTLVLLAGNGPDGLAVLPFRAAIWSVGLECYLAELYVTPARRGQGLGRALMEAALREARNRGADTMDIGVDEPDLAARHLYESLGFTNRAGGDGPVMYVYERDL